MARKNLLFNARKRNGKGNENRGRGRQKMEKERKGKVAEEGKEGKGLKEWRSKERKGKQ